MKQIFLFAFSLCAWLTSPAQLNVTGQASMTVKPEITQLSYTVVSTEDSYEAAITSMTRRIDALADALSKLAFDEEAIKTSNFNIRQNRKYRQGEPKGEEYVASQTLEIRFGYSKKRLLEVLNSTASASSSPSVAIVFMMSDSQKEEVKKQLIRMAVADAKQQAELIAKETGYSIQGINEINYGNSPIRPRPFAGAMNRLQTMSESDMSNFEAKDLTVSDQVFISYEISQ